MPNPLSKAYQAIDIDKLLSRLSAYSTKTPRSHGGIRIDPRGGLGETPDAGNIDYRGFQAFMTPQEFLSLNPKRPGGYEHVTQAVQGGEPISTPMLYVRREATDAGPAWRVENHEGRGRMHAIADRNPDALLPVGIHPAGEIRARHLRPDDLWAAIYPEMRDSASVVRPRLVIHNMAAAVRPGSEGDEAVIRALIEMAGE